MKLFLLVFLFWTAMDSLPYHPRLEVKLQVNILSGSVSYIVKSQDLFLETFFHDDVDLCIENHLNATVSIKLWDTAGEGYSNSLTVQRKWTAIARDMIANWIPAIRDGLNITITSNSSSTRGSIYLKRCRRDIFTTLGNELTSRVIPYQSWDSTVHVPFFVLQNQNVTKYVDFSTILPRRVMVGNDWTRKAFCMNATLGGNVKVHMSRCKSSRAFTIELEPTENRKVVRYWHEIISLEEKCLLGEATLPDHLWLDIESVDHNEVGEIIIYNCHHTWVLNDDLEEEIRITPTLDRIESDFWSFEHVVLPFRRNVYFAPIKHMIDTALVTGSDVRIQLQSRLPLTVSFSACYNSLRYELFKTSDEIRANMTREQLQILSNFSNILNCPEEKTHHGVYLSVGAEEAQVTSSVTFRLVGQKGVETPEGTLKNDKFTTVAFNLLKGHRISRNVHIINLIRQGASNGHVELNQMFNSTGLVQLYISRCEFSPKLKLFGPMKMGPATFDQPTLDFILQLYQQTECLSDFQPKRYEYKEDDYYGLYLHVEAIEDSIGYTATYESFEAAMTFYELNEEHVSLPYERKVSNFFRVFKTAEVWTEFAISHLLDRAVRKPAVSLRFYVESSGPLMFAITKCKDDIKKDWNKMIPRQNDTYTAWYTFDSEGIDLLKGYSDTMNCISKPHPQIFVHLKSERQISVYIEFSIVDGIDLNQVEICPISKKLDMQDKEMRQKLCILMLEVAMVAVAILAGFALLQLYERFRSQKHADGTQVELADMEEDMDTVSV